MTPNTPGPRQRFPTVEGRSLLGDDLTLPGDLPADRTLVVVAFRQWHQQRVDRWISRAVAAGVPGTPRGEELPMRVAVVEVPALSNRWRPVRRFIDGGMSSGIGDPDILARTITAYTDVGALRRALSIPTDDEVQAYVVTRAGEILAHGEGEPVDTVWEPVGAALLDAS